MSNPIKSIRFARGNVSSLFVAVLLRTCRAGSAQNEGHRIRNIVLVTVRGRMVRDGRVFTTSWSRMATTSASSRNRKPLSKTMWLPRSAPLALAGWAVHILSAHS